ncbi:hypothetical protein [Sediminispirochaeta bajacaliforniensis]|uniref:hypothetical protein n=1 Tax=Sediminispirochaeta bajacaliforniensis TaxID=148 RepID=UPI00036CAFEE|nr:hypothetical protein [Sediminispirochaeta bajacaliforniensis]
MKRLTIGGMLFFVTAILFAQESFTVTFSNQTGYDINELYISPSSSDDWQDDLLNGNSVRDGESSDVQVPLSDPDAAVYDVLAVDIDGDRYTRYEVDLSDAADRTITFTFDDYSEGSDGGGSDSSDSYNQGYLDGYREAWREAYKEAYSEGYRSGLEDAGALSEHNR